MLLDKFQYLPGNAWVGTDVTIIHFETLLYGLEHMLVFPSRDAPLRPFRALRFERASRL
jgi:hypothetical protein